MSLTFISLLLVGLALLAYFIARAKGRALTARPGGTARTGAAAVHSRPAYHGSFVALWVALPALALIAGWAVVSEGVIADRVIDTVPAASRPATQLDRDAFMSEVRGVVNGEIEEAFNPDANPAAKVYVATKSNYNLLAGAAAAALAALGGLWGYSRLRPDFRARTAVEKVVMWTLILASLVAILTTFGIVLSLLFESIRFFQKVSIVEFLTGTTWSPQTAIRADQVGSSGSFGAVPLFWGTIFIGAIIAMFVAIPLGLMSAIYLTQYAGANIRKWVKPLLEILAGIPTVVYGYFAALTVAPLIRDLAEKLGMENPSTESALAAGLVMGVMIIPFVSSMADDSIAAVPQAMRDGSLAMGATTSETIKKVLIPAALPGIGDIVTAVGSMNHLAFHVPAERFDEYRQRLIDKGVRVEIGRAHV